MVLVVAIPTERKALAVGREALTQQLIVVAEAVVVIQTVDIHLAQRDL
jgi:hypothetical protein